jgi:two-component system cell cycle response regulator
VTGTDPQRLLIIEDDPEIQYILSVILGGDGRHVTGVDTAEKARAELGRGDVDLVILDLILPDSDGRTLLSELRAGAATASVPVVVMTARATPEIRQDCYGLGADAFVEKPFDPEKLAADIAARLERVAQAERTAHADSVTGLLNRAGLNATCAQLDGGYGLGVIQLDGFAGRSERWGWDRSGRVVREVAEALREALPEEIHLGSLGGGDFAMVAPGADLEVVNLLAREALEIVKTLEPRELQADDAPLTATIAVLVAEAETPLEDALEVARQKLFQARAAEGGHVVAEGAAMPTADGRVLVAEDDEISATILLHRLDKEGLDVERFDNGQEAYEAALAETPILVILDVKMPGLDGFEVLERLRKDHRFSAVPVIMLTSMGQEADVVRAFRMGADDYILKPFSPTELSARVRRLLTRGRSASSL